MNAIAFKLDEFSAVLWKLGEQGGLDLEPAAGLFATLLAADIIAVFLAFPVLRRWRWAWIAALPFAWTAAFYLLPTCPVWLMPHPLFFLRLPAALLLATISAFALKKVSTKIRIAVPIVTFLAISGSALFSPFIDAADAPRRRLVNDAPAFVIEHMTDEGRFGEIMKRPIEIQRLRRLEVAYRALASFRTGNSDNPAKLDAVEGWEQTTTPLALMDGFKLLYAYGFVLPARRVIMELSGETEGGRKLIHDRYLGDIAFVCGERRLAEHHYRLLAKSRIFRKTAYERLRALRSGMTAFDVPDLHDVATLYHFWKQDAEEKREDYFMLGQNLEAFVYTHFNHLKAKSIAPVMTEPVEEKTFDPNYSGATVPYNIAPLNFDFICKNDSKNIAVGLRSADGETLNGSVTIKRDVETRAKCSFVPGDWCEFLSRHRGESLTVNIRADNIALTNFPLTVSNDKIDRALTFRLIEPSYGVFGEMSIVERELSSFKENVLDHNHNEKPGDRRCMNCHTTLKDGSGSYLRHYRGKHSGTLIESKKYGRKFANLKKEGTEEGPTYPAWHPSGDFIAISMNQTRQSFKYVDPTKIEVYDLSSSLALYSLADGSLVKIPSAPTEKECYPAWDPTGHLLFTSCCVSNDVYDLRVRRFDPASKTFSLPETVIDANASKLSVLHTRISPGGNWAVVTVTGRGVFPIWHRDADLYVINLRNRTARVASELNSSEAETFHNFSSDGNWMVYASRRDNGNVTRLYLAHFDKATGFFGRPFRLPAEDPEAESIRRFSYNTPDFAQ